MTRQTKTITIGRDRLLNYLACFCSHRRQVLNSDRRVCDRQLPDECNVDMVDKIVWQCPSDCPRWNQTKWKACEPQKCSIIRKALKELTDDDRSAERYTD